VYRDLVQVYRDLVQVRHFICWFPKLLMGRSINVRA
jgi:hypothetical protein